MTQGMQLAQCEPREIAGATPLLPLSPRKSALWSRGGISASCLMSAGDVLITSVSAAVRASLRDAFSESRRARSPSRVSASPCEEPLTTFHTSLPGLPTQKCVCAGLILTCSLRAEPMESKVETECRCR